MNDNENHNAEVEETDWIEEIQKLAYALFESSEV
jgi:hypothetical protein